VAADGRLGSLARAADLLLAVRHRVLAAAGLRRRSSRAAVAGSAAQAGGAARDRAPAHAALAGRDPDRVRRRRPAGAATFLVAAPVGLDALPGLKTGDSARATHAAPLRLPVSTGPALR